MEMKLWVGIITQVINLAAAEVPIVLSLVAHYYVLEKLKHSVHGKKRAL